MEYVGVVLCFSKMTAQICSNIFQGLGESTCSMQPAMKSTAPRL